MKFTDIPKECPKAWELFVSDFCSKHIHFDEVEDAILSDFDASFGYLLKFFSSHGIEIERRVDIYNGNVWYSVKWKEPIGGALNFYHKKTFDTLEEAIVKAFQIIEGRVK